jgi:hypothetical protein
MSSLPRICIPRDPVTRDRSGQLLPALTSAASAEIYLGRWRGAWTCRY